jgi:hypothetical protein
MRASKLTASTSPSGGSKGTATVTGPSKPPGLVTSMSNGVASAGRLTVA